MRLSSARPSCRQQVNRNNTTVGAHFLSSAAALTRPTAWLRTLFQRRANLFFLQHYRNDIAPFNDCCVVQSCLTNPRRSSRASPSCPRPGCACRRTPSACAASRSAPTARRLGMFRAKPAVRHYTCERERTCASLLQESVQEVLGRVAHRAVVLDRNHTAHIAALLER